MLTRYAAFMVMAVALSAASAQAQSLDIQHGRLSVGTTGLTIVQGAQSEAPKKWRAGVDLQFMLRPLVLTNQGQVLTSVVSSQLGLHLRGAYGITQGIDVGASLAFVPYEHISAAWHNGGFLRTSQATAGVGDLWLQSRFQVASQARAGVDVALCPVLHIPSFDSHFLSDGSVAFAPEVQVARQQGPVLIAANLGAIVRGEQVVDGFHLGNQVTWRVGAGYDLAQLGLPARSMATLETYGLTALSRPFSGATPVEWLVSGRYPWRDFLGTVGVGSGLSGGYGAPQLRLLASVSWAPMTAQAPVVPAEDRDKDGIIDAQDSCPDAAETVNGFQDGDGCPDVADRDGDGIPDDKDKCPDQAEDKDGFEDDDGCPDPDNDHDTIPDHLDKCPDQAEDFDGVADEDGCPEIDQDGDGIPDDKDKCPLQAEVINGVEDEDGCPDQGEALVELKEDTVELKGTVYFGVGSDTLLKHAFGQLNQLVSLLHNHQELQILVEGYSDADGSVVTNLRLSKRRAESVRQYLTDKGIVGERIKTAGYGENHPRAANTDARSRALNRRVTIKVIKSEAAATPPAAPEKPAPSVP